MAEYRAFDGLFKFEYTLDRPFNGEMYVNIKVLNGEEYYNEKEAEGLSEEELKTLDYPESSWVHILFSPFKVINAVSDIELLDTYRDLTSAGLSLTYLSTIDALPLNDNHRLSSQTFRITISPRNIF